MPPEPQKSAASNRRVSAGLRRRVARARLVGLCGLGLLGLVACGPDVVTPVPTPSGVPAAATAAAPSTPSGTAAAALPTPGSAAVGPAAGTPASADRCRSDGLAARFAPLPDDLGAHRVAVVWTNTADRPCTMTGFGGVDLHGPDVPAIGPTLSVRRSAERPATVTLAPHATALAVVHYLSPGATGPRWTPTSALVTPPDETRSVPLTWTFGPVLRQDGATRPGTFLSPVQAPGDRAGPTACRPDQVTAAIVVGDAAASHREARLELTARRGQSCRVAGPLVVGVRSVGRVPVRVDGGGGSGGVPLDATHRASATVAWTVAADRPVTPQALTVTLPGGPIEVRWTFGPVDAGPTRGLAVGPLTGGTASH